jgi:aryl-alcohol dehydrogenase-like predicted oxidoreductase
LVIATKAGFRRPGPDDWRVDCRPEALRAGLEGSLKRLGVERIDLWQLHRIDRKVPRKEQFDAIREFRQQGLVRHIGLSEVEVADIGEAQTYFQVATVQNHWHPRARGSDDVLAYCEDHTIGFLPWAPLGSGALARASSVLAGIAKAKGATPSQVAIAWSLRKSPVVVAIPGTGKLAHLEENVAAAGIALTEAEMAEIETLGR